MDDISLVRQAQNGDHSAFEKLYRKYLNLVYGYVFKKTSSQQDCEDLTSEIWLNVLESLESFDEKSSFKNWVFGIVKYKILDYYREKYKMVKTPLLEDIFIEEDAEKDEKSDPEHEHKLLKILERLPENYKKVLELRFLKGYTTGEIAGELNLSISNVKILQHRALKKARILE